MPKTLPRHGFSECHQKYHCLSVENILLNVNRLLIANVTPNTTGSDPIERISNFQPSHEKQHSKRQSNKNFATRMSIFMLA